LQLGWCRIALISVALPALAACSGAGGGPPPPEAGTTGSTGSNLSARVGNWFSPTPAAGPAAAPNNDPDCPPLDVRLGASTIIVYGKGEQASTNVRYQASVAQTARECIFTPSTVTMKIGLQGRIIVGPMGGPGRIDLPIRFAVVKEGPEPKPIWTKLYKTSVDVPSGETNVPFVHIDNSVTFPNPGAGALEAYVVYVGFDNGGAKTPKGRGNTASAMPGADPGLPPDTQRPRGRRGGRHAQ
jgi:hypothetical protein